MDKGRCKSHFGDTRARHHEQWSTDGDTQWLQHMDVGHTKCANGRPWPIHVPSEYRSNENASKYFIPFCNENRNRTEQKTPMTIYRLHCFCVIGQTAYLEVVIPPDIVYEETSGDMMVPEGSSAKLVCKARGYPKPKITWLVHWCRFSAATKVKIQFRFTSRRRREDGREIIARNGSHGKTKGKFRSLLFAQRILWPNFCLHRIYRSIGSWRWNVVADENHAVGNGHLPMHCIESSATIR